MIRDNTRMIVINFPHNPTGATISVEDQNRIVQIAREKNIFIFSDEMYRFLEYDPKDRLPSMTELYDNAVSLSGLSKAFSLPGLRIGWLTSQNRQFLDTISRYRDYTTICSSAPSEILAIIALRARNKIVSTNLKILRDNMEHINHFFMMNRSLFKWLPPKAGPVAFPRVLFTQNTDFFCEEVVRGAGVLLAPSSQFNFQTHHIRIGLGRKNLPEALKKLSAFIDQNYKIE
jgi:aspartate/methionine/tyrosine aminotransferase